MANQYDVVILGGGIGGYIAALRASQLGLKTAIVEKDKIGGTCLHRGCIPSKAFLKSAEVYRLAKHASQFGVEIENVQLNFTKVQNEKNKIVQKLYDGLLYLIKRDRIDIYEGKGKILGPSIFSPLSGTISVELDGGKSHETLVSKNLLIATGSKPRSFPLIPYDHNYILSSDDALQLQELPQSMIILGGGTIGIEWASLLNDYGVQVTILEMADQILPSEDKDVSEAMMAHLKKKGIQIITNANVLSHKIEQEEVIVQYESLETQSEVSANKLLISIGREPNVENIGIENTDIRLHHDYIETNDMYQTSESHIYAIGDCIGGVQLAHVAAREGVIAIEHLAGLQPEKLDHHQIVKCVYSSPEIASVGLTEDEAKAQNFDIKVGKIPFQANGKALINRATEGFAKVIADAKTEDLLGVHLFGHHVTELISEAGLAKVLDATPWEMSQTIHPHPSLSEIIGEAALAVDNLQFHF